MVKLSSGCSTSPILLLYGRPTIMDPQGNPRATSAIGNALMFQGRQYDPETGFYWYRSRYYDPRAGRFTSRDTIGIWGDPLNLGNGYTFVGNNPWTMVDPYGEGPIDWLLTGDWNAPPEVRRAASDAFAMSLSDRSLGTGDAIVQNVSFGYARSVGGTTFDAANRANANTTATIIISSAELATGAVGVYQGLQAISAAGGLATLGAGGVTVTASGAAALTPAVAVNAAALPAVAGTATAAGAVAAAGHSFGSMNNPGGSSPCNNPGSPPSKPQKHIRRNIKDVDAVDDINCFLGKGQSSNVNPFTGRADPNRIFARQADGTWRSVRFGGHEMGKDVGKGMHYHLEQWDSTGRLIVPDESVNVLRTR